MPNNSRHRPARSPPRAGRRQSVIGSERPLQQAARLVRAFLVYRVAHRTLSRRYAYAVGRRGPGSAMRREATGLGDRKMASRIVRPAWMTIPRSKGRP
jgi:hypothetical protein